MKMISKQAEELIEKSDCIYIIATQGNNNFVYIESNPKLESHQIMDKISSAMLGSIKQFLETKSGNGSIPTIVAASAIKMFPQIAAASLTTPDITQKN